MFGSDFSSQSVAAEDHVGFDLCVLASSDHTVMTYGTNLSPLCNNHKLVILPGTFGLWGSLLAGGDVIASKGRSNETLTEEDEIYLRSALPGWLYIDTRDTQRTRVLEVNTATANFTPVEL